MRSESEVFNEIAELCVSPGYIHAIAFLSFRDNLIRFETVLNEKSMENQYASERLLRTEISTLVGLMIKKDIDYSLPKVEIIDGYISKTQALLSELHLSLTTSMINFFKNFEEIDLSKSPFSKGENLREPIFYSGESAYVFQYTNFARKKYSADAEWLLNNKGFTINDAVSVVEAIQTCLSEKRLGKQSLKERSEGKYTFLPMHKFNVEDLKKYCSVAVDIIKNVVRAFCLDSKEKNSGFNSLNEFNIFNAMPIIDAGQNEFVVLQFYSLVESLYESPFFWMMGDKTYTSIAQKNRGVFTELLITSLLRKVFGFARVYQNIDVYRGKSRISEADVLVIYGNRAIVVQAKSKRLTMEARKGNDQQIKEDFKKAVQDAANQAYICAESLLDNSCKFMDCGGNQIDIPRVYSAILPVCVVCDHYPALAFQADQFLVKKSNEIIALPVTTDIFAIDVMTEMLESPLHFLHYLTLRAKFGQKFKATQELTLLAYHLAHNLWGQEDLHMTMLSDNISTDLNIAMIVRREGIPGNATPDGILTRLRDTAFGRLFAQIELRDDPRLVDLGLLLLQIGEETARSIGKSLDLIASYARKDGQVHDLSVPFSEEKSGFTVHCRSDINDVAMERLAAHCEIRKYSTKSDSWFGLILEPEKGRIRADISKRALWVRNESMEEALKRFPLREPQTWRAIMTSKPPKIGRNSLCPCGSQKKFKKCCL